MSAPTAPQPSPSDFTRRIEFSRRTKPEHVVYFARNLDTMLRAGVALNEALVKIADTMASDAPSFAAIIRQAHYNVEQRGCELGDAFRPYERRTGPVFVELLDAGAKTGTLGSTALPAIARIYGLIQRARSARMTAALYPIAVLVISIVFTYFAANTIIPSFLPLFDLGGKHTELPLVTTIVLAYAELWQSVWGLAALAVVLTTAVVVVLWANRNPKIRPYKDKLKFRLPVYAKLWKAEAFAETLAIFGAMISAGISMRDALELSAKTSPNLHVAEALRTANRDIETRGMTLYASVAKENVFPPTVLAALEVGEKSGALDQTTQMMAEYFFDEAATTRVRIEKVTEYLMMAVLGAYVCVLLLAVFMPLYSGVDKLTGH